MPDHPEGEGSPDGEAIDVAGMIGCDEIGAPIWHVVYPVDAEATEEPEEETEEAVGQKGDDEGPGLVGCSDIGQDGRGRLAF